MRKYISAAVNGGHRRHIQGAGRHLPAIISALTAAWCLYQSIWSTLDIVTLTIVFLSLTTALTFVLYTPTKTSDTARVPIGDYILAVLAIVGGVFFISKVDVMATRISLFDPLSFWDITFSTMLILMLMEAVRRTVGITLCIMVLFLLGYNLYGNYMPGFLWQPGVSYLHYLDIVFFTTDGVFGTPLRVASTYGFLFVMFGTLLHRCGAGEFFYKISSSAGRSAGGPAKIAVISSGLFGSTSGNPVADVVTTGSITIPVMIRSGFAPVQAAAIEATACTGGSLVPPVMGAAAFIMAEFTGIPYRYIALSAVIPALLYYGSLYLQVHFNAKYNGIEGSREKADRFWTVIRKDFLFLVPLIVLLIVLSQGYSPSMVAFSALVSLVITATVRKSTRMDLKVLYEQLTESTERVLPVAMACAASGLVMAGLTMTGLSNKFGGIIEFTSHGNIWLALITAAILSILLGMGLPTSASYILSAVLIGSILQDVGLHVLQAHMFLLYFAAMSAITPPVAIASFVAAAVAKTDPMTTSWVAMRKATIVMILPFAFAAHAGLLLEGTVPDIVLSVVFAVIGVILVSGAIEKYLLGRLLAWERLALFIGGLMCLLTPVEWQVVGLIVGAVGAGRNALVLRRGDSEDRNTRLVESTAEPHDK